MTGIDARNPSDAQDGTNPKPTDPWLWARYQEVCAEAVKLTKDRDALLDKIATAYQIVGAISHYAGLFDHPDVQRALDYLSDEDDFAELLPWPSVPLTEVDDHRDALQAENDRLREALSKAAGWFDDFANAASEEGSGFDATRNSARARVCRAALNKEGA
jgi:hypothetical protein